MDKRLLKKRTCNLPVDFKTAINQGFEKQQVYEWIKTA